MANFFSDNKNLLFHLQNDDMERIVNLKERNFLDAKSYVEAPASYEEAMENYKLVLEIVGEIAADLIAPNAEGVDAEGPKVVNNEILYASGTSQNHNALRDAGLYGMALPRKYNGLNFPYLPYVMAAEIISRADASFANIWGLQDCASTICEFGSEEQKEQFISDISMFEFENVDWSDFGRILNTFTRSFGLSISSNKSAMSCICISINCSFTN